jgi:hypothetical protein
MHLLMDLPSCMPASLSLVLIGTRKGEGEEEVSKHNHVISIGTLNIHCQLQSSHQIYWPLLVVFITVKTPIAL